MNWKDCPYVKSVHALDDYELEVLFENGECKRFDVKPYLSRGIFVRLENRSLFQAVREVAGSIEWPGGVDLSYETLYVEGHPIVNIDELQNIDGLASLGLEPRTWYRFVQLQIDLLRNHVAEVEKQIQASVLAYQQEAVATDIEKDANGYLYVILQKHRETEGSPDQLEEIFEYYFPNLQRRGALSMLFSFFEHELNRLCQLFAEVRGLRVLCSDMKGSPVERSRLYLRKVIGLPMNDDSGAWREIKTIQTVRNLIVHNDARIEKGKKDVLKLVDEAVHLSTANESRLFPRETDEVNILEGYLSHVLDIIDLYCSELNKAIGILSAG